MGSAGRWDRGLGGGVEGLYDVIKRSSGLKKDGVKCLEFVYKSVFAVATRSVLSQAML